MWSTDPSLNQDGSPFNEGVSIIGGKGVARLPAREKRGTGDEASEGCGQS